ncbi:Galectin [Aphelenchoides bicaudatus]|nr:Galectin [Aphelenchoides bicaudatus]
MSNIEYRRQRVPFIKPIHGGLPVGSKVELECAAIGENQRSFLLEYTSANNLAVQIEVNLNGEGVDLRSSVAGKPPREEWLPTLIPADKVISLNVLTKQNFFEITLNGKHLRDFDHQCQLSDINRLSIRGDVGLQCVRFAGFEQNLEPPRPGCENFYIYSNNGLPLSTRTRSKRHDILVDRL